MITKTMLTNKHNIGRAALGASRRDGKIMGYLATWLLVLGYLATWLLGYLATWLLGYLDTWILGYLCPPLVVLVEARSGRAYYLAMTQQRIAPRPLREVARPTTILQPARLAARLGLDLLIASETFQHTGSFKFRAAYHLA